MSYYKLSFIPALAGLLLTLGPSVARADQDQPAVCPARSSIFGTIIDVHPNAFTLHTDRNALGDIHIILDENHHIFTNGLDIRDGVFAGIYGCLQPDHSAFHAEDVTLAENANVYNGYKRHTVKLDGNVLAVESNRILIHSERGDIWVYTSQSGFKTGERVRAVGTLDPVNIAFNATSVTVIR